MFNEWTRPDEAPVRTVIADSQIFLNMNVVGDVLFVIFRLKTPLFKEEHLINIPGIKFAYFFQHK
jgi:hypothetical protein